MTQPIKIFISYRRDDSRETTERLHDQMIAHFGEENVFQDVDNIPIGVNFRTYIQDEIAKCDVVLVVIGTEWGRIMRERASQSNDFVRIEIESALKLGKFVVPVTVKDAKMPDMAQLPSSIEELGWLNAATLRFNPYFKQDCLRLAEAVKAELTRRQAKQTVQPPPPKPDPVQEALTRAREFIKTGKRNVDWKPFPVTFDDIEQKNLKMPFCLVPTGTFQMGSDDKKYDDEEPVHPQTFNQPFYIAQYPVTNGQWKVAVTANAVKEPVGEDALKWYNDLNMANAPVVGVSWFECQKFATWAGCRLPTEREWEYSARGIESLRYPWGNDWDENKLVWSKNSGGQPNDVTSKPEEASWIGASHLSGNVWEWCASLYESYPYPTDGTREVDTADRTDVRRVVRGGSWYYAVTYSFRGAFRGGLNPIITFNYGGFRLARSS